MPSEGGGTWLGALQAAFENIPIAAAITDMKVPGVNVQWCNKGFERVTGYPKEETEGRNCRFLQGSKTEAKAVTKMVRALRYAKDLVIDVTNHRKDGAHFTNDLSLTAVHDLNGEYRYSIGILSHKEFQTDAEKSAIAQIRELLPRKMPAGAQEAAFVQDVQVDADAKKKQFKTAMIKFTKLLWTIDTEASLEKLMEVPEAREAFHNFLEKTYEHTQLDFWAEAKKLEFMKGRQKDKYANEICEKFLGMDKAAALAMDAKAVVSKSAEFYQVLANDSFPKFIKSKGCDPIVEAMLGNTDKNAESAKSLIWKKYKVPSDMEGFVFSFVAVAETFPACIVISDMSIPGNPMFFINQEFTKITGYSKSDAQGRNCRFLQGPKTEPASVAVIQDTLRRGVDCYVRITNYRKSGETFQNLLSMRPVHDSNGVYRFCIGVQFEV
ncbi:PAS domain-containing protein, partial [Pavlovales sp. CCMP2436]